MPFFFVVLLFLSNSCSNLSSIDAFDVWMQRNIWCIVAATFKMLAMSSASLLFGPGLSRTRFALVFSTPPLGYWAWTYYKMDNGLKNGAYSFLCKLLSGAGQHQGAICFRIMGLWLRPISWRTGCRNIERMPIPPLRSNNNIKWYRNAPVLCLWIFWINGSIRWITMIASRGPWELLSSRWTSPKIGHFNWALNFNWGPLGCHLFHYDSFQLHTPLPQQKNIWDNG